MNCTFCHNPETISTCKNIEGTTEYTVDQLVDVIKESIPFITGITVSGGEATLNYKFLEELFIETKKLGLTNLSDTNGYLPLYTPQTKNFVEATDGFMLDIKAMDNTDHIRLTGKSNKTIIENAKFLAKIGKLTEIRTVLMDGEKNEYTVDTITDVLIDYPEVKYKLISYRPFGVRDEFLNIKTVSAKEKAKLTKLVESKNFTVIDL